MQCSTHLQTTGRTILVGMQYTHCNEELQEGGEHQCDYTIFDPFLEHIPSSAEYTQNVLIPSTYLRK